MFKLKEGSQPMKRIVSVLAAASLLLGGCAHSYVDMYEPVIDTGGVDVTAYNVDLNQCRDFAVREDPVRKAQQQAIAGAIAGALIGAAVGGAYGRAGQGAGVGAVEGTALGGLHGAAEGVQAQELIVKRCMAGRGYRVLY